MNTLFYKTYKLSKNFLALCFSQQTTDYIFILIKNFIKSSSILFIILILSSSKVFAGVTYVDSINVYILSGYQGGYPQDIKFNNDGTKMFVVGDNSNAIREYHLTTGFDISTASYDSLFSVNSQDTNPRGLAFNNDGTKMFVAGWKNQRVFEYHLTTGFDISTASYDSNLSISSNASGSKGLAFNSDGTKMFVNCDNSSDEVVEYTLSTGFDVSTASYDSSFVTQSQDTSPQGLAFSNDGKKMFVAGDTGDDINEYTLSTGFDVSTASFVGSFDVSSQGTTPTGITFNNDGTKMFITDQSGTPGTHSVDEYTLTTGFELINTAPTLSSSSPSDGATSVGVNDNIVLTFSEAVDAESGNILIKKSSDNSTVETINVAGGLVSGSGSTIITINPSSTLDGDTGYYITIAATAFDDVDSASYAGFTNSTTLNFTTVETTSSIDPLTDKDVVGSIEAQTEAPKRILQYVTTPVINRMQWLRHHRKETNLTNQNIKFQFSNAMLASLSNVITASIDINENLNLSDNWSTWSEGSISVTKIGDTSTSSEKEIDSQGIAFGFDKKINDNDIYGFAIQYGQSDTDIGSNGSGIDSKNYNISMYRTRPLDDNNFIEGSIGIGKIKSDIERKSDSNTLTASRDGNQIFGSVNFGKTIDKGNFNLVPALRVDLGYTELEGYQEVGTNALSYDDQEVKSGLLSLEFGVNNLVKFNDSKIKPFGLIEFGLDFSDSSVTKLNYVSDTSTTYTYTQDTISDYMLTSEVGFSYDSKNNLSINTSYKRIQGEKHEHTDTFSFGLNFKSKRETEYAMQFGGTEDFSAGLNVAKNIYGLDFNFKLDQEFNENLDKNAKISMIKKF
ncbi:autotransporter domain-containing protein [Candidatus Pelagibacter sp.]|nr:autotransporter domain-containing protein [Candidatus Pelagibacter sp.]